MPAMFPNTMLGPLNQNTNVPFGGLPSIVGGQPPPIAPAGGTTPLNTNPMGNPMGVRVGGPMAPQQPQANPQAPQPPQLPTPPPRPPGIGVPNVGAPLGSGGTPQGTHWAQMPGPPLLLGNNMDAAYRGNQGSTPATQVPQSPFSPQTHPGGRMGLMSQLFNGQMNPNSLIGRLGSMGGGNMMSNPNILGMLSGMSGSLSG